MYKDVKNQIVKFVLIIIFCFTISDLGFTKESIKLQVQNKTSTIDNSHYINANDILMFVTNHGNFGRDLSGVIGIDAGTWYPYSGDMDDYFMAQTVVNYFPLYAAGVWISGKVNGDIRVATSEYASEYVPGPMLNDTAQTDLPEFKVYKLFSDSLSTNPNDDYTNWPVDQGAPVDYLGRPVMRGDQMLWSVYNDADTAKHVIYATDPFGIEIQQTTIAYAGSPQSIFIEYKLYNRSSQQIDSCYFSLWSDPDIGFASDDFIGCDTLDNYFYAYNSDNDETNYNPLVPPAIGFQYVYGPMIPSMGDSAYFDGIYIHDYTNLPMTSVNKYIGGVDPDVAEEVFNYAKGLDRIGNPIIYNGNEIKYVCSGDPTTGTGDIDVSPADRRVMGSAGPFSFAPGDSQFVMIRMAAAQGVTNLNSITQLDNVMNQPFNIPTNVEENSDDLLPAEFTLQQNYPNPFNPTTTIEYSLPTRSNIKLEIFNILGQKVRTLLQTNKSAGNYTVEWDSKDDFNNPVASGIYLYKLTTETYTQSKKMSLIK